jgi:ABC-type iron transport system FetAB permease component
MKSGLKVGFMVGAISGVAAIVVYYLLCFLLDVTFEKITPVSIFLMSIVVNMIGALIYAKLKKQSAKPRWMYAFITIVVALALSLFDWAFPAEPGIAGVANTLHGFVATLSIAWLPGWMDKTVRRTKS